MVRIVVDENRQFQRAINKASKKLDDLRIPLGLISREWFKSNKAIFTLGGFGKYEAYSPSYMKWKLKNVGNISVMKVTGKLERSITDPSDRYSVNEITNKKELTLGTKVVSKRGAPYAIYLQNGTKFMPARPPVLFGHEQVAPSKLNKRVSNWAKILETYMLQKSGEFGTVQGLLDSIER